MVLNKAVCLPRICFHLLNLYILLPSGALFCPQLVLDLFHISTMKCKHLLIECFCLAFLKNDFTYIHQFHLSSGFVLHPKIRKICTHRKA